MLRKVQSLNFLGRNRESLDLLLGQRGQVERLQDPLRAAPYFFSLGISYGLLGDQRRAVECLDRSIEEAKRCGDERTMGRAYALQTLQSYWAGRPEPGLEYGREAVTLLGRTQQRYWLGLAYFYIATVHYMMGNLEAAISAATEARLIGENLAHSGVQSYARFTVGTAKVLMRDWDAGIDECRAALTLSPDPLTGLATGVLGYAHLEKGDTAQAIQLLEEATSTMQRFGYRQQQGWYTVLLAESYLVNRQPEKARDLAFHGLDITREAEFPFGVGVAERAVGRIAQARGDFTEAETYLRQAVQSFESIPARFELARTHLDLALLAHARHAQEAAAAHFAQAQQLFSALRLERHVELVSQLAHASGVSIRHQPAP